MEDRLRMLERLSSLHERGLLTDREFQNEKMRLLEQRTPQSSLPDSEIAVRSSQPSLSSRFTRAFLVAALTVCVIFALRVIAINSTTDDPQQLTSVDQSNEALNSNEPGLSSAPINVKPTERKQAERSQRRVANALATEAATDPDCSASILQDVSAIEDSSSVLHAGDTYSSVTQFWRNTRTGESYFCAHGSYCYPAFVSVNGQRLEAIKLTNCSVGSEAGRDGDEVQYIVM